ncbi:MULTISPECIES: BREX system serine/threonine kinase PglW [Nocardia]|uniref:BREX system serine/threonine kinase PglW n=1 Tax=Nocardia abscessus TaxID=120957 RepID=UPI00189335F7|nr:BREX system serine/threonine kinase PglW [Nocardia abscessus]MBF6471617.1 BREX system serine/threonine kinase PglW [Nocardia abscessus]
MDEGRWTTVTESSFDHERRGLEAIRAKLPNTDPWFAWSNFTFTERYGHIREVDLLVIAPNGVHLIELKDWRGRLTVENGSWVRTFDNGRRKSQRNPLHLVNQKAKELASLLAEAGVQVFVDSRLCLTHPDLRFEVPEGDRLHTHTIRELAEVLQQPPSENRNRISPARAAKIAAALDRIGIGRSEADRMVGAYKLIESIGTGPTWTDYRAEHTDLGTPARIRIYLSERGADQAARTSVYEAAKREAAVLHRFRHPGVVRFVDIDSGGHPAGPALIFDYRPDTLRLDEYLAEYGASLDIRDRIALVRQLAETIRAAHKARVYHRGLAAHAVHVVPRVRDSTGRELSGPQRWQSPLLQISDWQVATQRSSTRVRGLTRFAPTALSAAHLAPGTDVYLAPELTAAKADPITMDVYGLGTLTYLLVVGQPPAASQAELLARFEAGTGLRPGAVVDGLSDDIDDLVDAATAYQPTRRLATVDEFLELLEIVEDDLTAPTAHDPEPTAPEKDALEAVAGDVLSGRWEVRRRLGTGSTSRAFLVRDLRAEAKSRQFAVLKVALSDDRVEGLTREAEVLGRLRKDARIIQVVEPGLMTIGDRTALLIEYVGDERELDTPADSGGTVTKRRRAEDTVARQLRDSGRLSVDQLEAYGEYLFGAVEFLEGEGVWHRDLKPDNIAIRVRPNRTRQLVLIDFSLAWYQGQEPGAGTDGYLDPFVGTLVRSSYDAHAERYALAATLHEMASAELPRWGDGSMSARQTDAKEYPYPDIAADAFDPSIRDGLVAFFRKALHRNTAERFDDLKPMRDAWRRIFLDLARSVPSRPATARPAVATPTSEDATPGIAPVEDDAAGQERDRIAAQVTRETHLSTAGLTSAAEQFLYGLDITTVGQLLDYSRRSLINAPGLGARTRTEIQDRQREWGKLLGAAAPLTREDRKAADAELNEVGSDSADDLGEAAMRTLSLDALVAELVPERNNNGSNARQVDIVTRLLQVPGVADVPDLGAWPSQKAVAATFGVTPAAISQNLKRQRQQWKKNPAFQAVRGELLELLEVLGRVASATELADALVLRRGTRLDGRERRRALALAAVRAVVEVEQMTPVEAEFRHTAKRESEDAAMVVLLALEADEGSGSATPSAPALLDYAVRLGKVADRLAELETLPTARTVLDRMAAIDPPAGAVDWDERRTVQIAVGASQHAAATPRLEIYPRDLPLVRAARLTQAGLVSWTPGVARDRQPGLLQKEVHERIRSRFPELADTLPTGSRLETALREAGFELKLELRSYDNELRFLPAHSGDASSFLSERLGRRATATTVTRYAEDPMLAAAALAEEQLVDASRRDGYRVLTVRAPLSTLAAAELTDRFSAEPVSVTALFLAALRELIPASGKPTWETILRADVAAPGTQHARKFGEYARTAWGRVEPQISELLDTAAAPVLMTDTLAYARYDAMGVLERLAETARHGGHGLWLLCPQDDPARGPRLGTTAVPFQPGFNEWISLPDDWVRNAHRASSANTPVGDRV